MPRFSMTSLLLSVLFALFLPLRASAARADLDAARGGIELDLHSASGIVIEQSTGEVLYEMNADEKLEPATVTKVMSLLLIFEALDDGTLTLDEGVVGSAYAASMGGSQIWLEEGETLTVDEMIKAMCVVSANDCTVAMAEKVAGSEEAFVVRMNERAETLGMTNTHFVNCTGLPVEGHYTTARDITVMTRELLKHEGILNYTTIWMDSLRGGKMALTNTNKLIRFYPGANGMKTGYTSSAKYCLSATAKRDDMQLIAAVMKGATSDERFADAKKLLDFGFANFSVHKTDITPLEPIYVRGGVSPYAAVTYGAKPKSAI